MKILYQSEKQPRPEHLPNNPVYLKKQTPVMQILDRLAFLFSYGLEHIRLYNLFDELITQFVFFLPLLIVYILTL